MKKLLVLALGLFLMLGVQSVSAAPPVPSGTLTLLTASPALGQVAQFEYTLSGGVNECPNGGTNKCARIQVVCSQSGLQVYADAAPAVHSTGFLLGGGSSVWLTNGGSADCVATLYFWDFHPNQTFVPLASVSFAAGG
jgi:hypothetical protein